MKELLLKTLSDSKGRIATAVAAFAVGYATNLFVRYNVAATPEVNNWITATVVGFVGWLIDALVLQINGKGIKKIQEALPPSVPVDGYAGPVTVQAVENAVTTQ